LRSGLATTLLYIFYIVFRFGGLFNLHVVKLIGIKDIATFQTLDVFRVFMSGDNSNPRVFAGGSHRFGRF
jgi:hypothetical protein